MSASRQDPCAVRIDVRYPDTIGLRGAITQARDAEIVRKLRVIASSS
jgi:hypothetical protein